MALNCQKLYDEANEFMHNDDYEESLKLFSEAISNCDKEDTRLLANCHIGRSQAYMKLKKYADALTDADAALVISQNDTRAFIKKGIALFNLKQFENALKTFEAGKGLCENDELEEKLKKLFNEWISKCEVEIEKLAHAKSAAEQKERTDQARNGTSVTNGTENGQQQNQVPPQIKHEWYQTEAHVTVSIMIKNVTASDVNISCENKTLKVESKNPDKMKLSLSFNLANPILFDQTAIKYLANKVEIKLKKAEALQWKKLEAEPSEAKIQKKPDYPTSSKHPKDWEKLAAEVKREESEEKGDNALDNLFKKIYADGSDETRRAMNKSFTESGGTVLSTNWKDIGAKKIDVNPPDGMEWKKWD